MIHIDLRIESADRPAAPRPGMRDPLLVGVLLVALAAYGGVRFAGARLSGREARVEEETAAARRDAARLSGSLGRVAAVTREQARLAATVSAIRALDPDRFAWVRLMDRVGSAVPENVWVDGMEMTDSAGFRVTGYAPSVELAAAFRRRLATAVRAAELGATTSTRIASFPVVRFELTGTAAEPAP
ncbi:MAG TPA: PilN domain-containing protein [Longimicrobium sp.]